ncbi:MAG TPA: ribosome maturation factor RimM [Spirochaetales bacterium]|nr:ribosome maturation factor RimM [Spirochaetales bacterium]
MDELAVGRLGAPHGLDGRVKAVSYSGEIDHLLALDEVVLRKGASTRRVRFESASPLGAGVLYKVAGYDSPEAARDLSGWEIWVPRSKAAPLGRDEYYFADLVGCVVYDGQQAVGRVEAVCEAGGGQLLELEIPGKPNAYVPFRSEFIGNVDVAAKRVELLAPWVLE